MIDNWKMSFNMSIVVKTILFIDQQRFPSQPCSLSIAVASLGWHDRNTARVESPRYWERHGGHEASWLSRWFAHQEWQLPWSLEGAEMPYPTTELTLQSVDVTRFCQTGWFLKNSTSLNVWMLPCFSHIFFCNDDSIRVHQKPRTGTSGSRTILCSDRWSACLGHGGKVNWLNLWEDCDLWLESFGGI